MNNEVAGMVRLYRRCGEQRVQILAWLYRKSVYAALIADEVFCQRPYSPEPTAKELGMTETVPCVDAQNPNGVPQLYEYGLPRNAHGHSLPQVVGQWMTDDRPQMIIVVGRLSSVVYSSVLPGFISRTSQL